MKAFNEDYKHLQADQKCLSTLPLEFIEKYNCIIYCKYEKGYLLLVNGNFKYKGIGYNEIFL